MRSLWRVLRGGGVLPKAHELGQQCTATAKATGRRCERRCIATTVCHVHGQRAKQVRQKQQERLAVYDARVAAAAEPAVIVRREAEEVLIDLLDDVTRILGQIKSELHGNVVSPALLAVAGEWFDRTARVAKVITDGDLAQKLHARVGAQARDVAAEWTGVLAAVLSFSPLSAEQRLAVWESRFAGLEAIRDERAPLRLSGDAVHRFGDGLMEAAAREQALAEGLPLGEDSSESDGVGSLVLFPSLDGNGFHG